MQGLRFISKGMFDVIQMAQDEDVPSCGNARHEDRRDARKQVSAAMRTKGGKAEQKGKMQQFHRDDGRDEVSSCQCLQGDTHVRSVPAQMP